MSDRELVVKARHGDIDAFAALIRKYANAVYGVAYGKLMDFHLAQDIAQEVFVKVYTSLGDIKDPEKVGSWLYTATRNACSDWLRNSKVMLPLEEATGESYPDETGLDVRQALAGLSESARLTVILHYIDGYSTKEIAAFLDLTPKAIENRLRKARLALREELKDMVESNLRENKLDGKFSDKIQSFIKRHYEMSGEGKQLEALEAARKALKLNPDDYRLQDILAHSLFRCGVMTGDNGYFRESESIYIDLVKVNPLSYQGLGHLYMAWKRFDKALECFEKLKSPMPDVRDDIAYTLSRKGEHEASIRMYEEVLFQGLSKAVDALRNLGSEYRSLRTNDMAYRHLEIVIRILESIGPEKFFASELIWSYFDLALLQVQDGLLDHSIQSLHKSLDAACAAVSGDVNNVLFSKVAVTASRYKEGTDLDWLVQELTSGPHFEMLKGLPGYEELVAKAKSCSRD